MNRTALISAVTQALTDGGKNSAAEVRTLLTNIINSCYNTTDHDYLEINEWQPSVAYVSTRLVKTTINDPLAVVPDYEVVMVALADHTSSANLASDLASGKWFIMDKPFVRGNNVTDETIPYDVLTESLDLGGYPMPNQVLKRFYNDRILSTFTISGGIEGVQYSIYITTEANEALDGLITGHSDIVVWSGNLNLPISRENRYIMRWDIQLMNGKYYINVFTDPTAP